MKNVLNQSFTELQMGIRRELAIHNRSFFVVLKLAVFSATPDTGIYRAKVERSREINYNFAKMRK